MNEYKWKSVDGDCLFEDENGNQFYSSPEQDLRPIFMLLGFASIALPFLMALAFKLGGL